MQGEGVVAPAQDLCSFPMERKTKVNVPINIAVVLPTRRVLFAEFHTSKDAFLALHRTDEFYLTMHGARYIDEIANGDVTPISQHVVADRVVRDCGLSSGQGVEGCLSGDGG